MQPLQLFKLDKIVNTLEILTDVKNFEQNCKHISQLGDRGRKAAKEDRDLKKFISSEMAHRDEVFIRYSSKSNIQFPLCINDPTNFGLFEVLSCWTGSKIHFSSFLEHS